MRDSFLHCKTDVLPFKVMLRMLRAHHVEGERRCRPSKGVCLLGCRGKGVNKLQETLTWHPLTPDWQAERITLQLVFNVNTKGTKPVPATDGEPGQTKRSWKISSPLAP